MNERETVQVHVARGHVRTSDNCARLRAFLCGQEIVPVSPATSVHELDAHLLPRFKVPPVEVAGARSLDVLLHAYL